MDRLGCWWRDWEKCRADADLCALEERPFSPPGLDCSKTVAENALRSSECVMKGRCDDHELHRFYDPQTYQHDYGCILPIMASPLGEEGCFDANGKYSTIFERGQYGCFWRKSNGANESVCLAQGGWWSRAAKTEAECNSQGPSNGSLVCKTPWNDVLPVSAFTPDENGKCPKCMSHWESPTAPPADAVPFASWEPATYAMPKFNVKLTWKKMTREPV